MLLAFCLPARAGQFARLLGGETTSSNLPAPVLWLIADDISGSDGDAITTWPDSSGFARDAGSGGVTSPVLKTGVLNGHDILRFDGVSNHMATPAFDVGATGSTTILVVFVRRSVSGTTEGDYAFQYGAGLNDYFLDSHTGASPAGTAMYWGLAESTRAVQATNVVYVALQRADGVGYYNETLQGPVTPDYSLTDHVDKSLRFPAMNGAVLPSENDYAEILVWDVPLTNQQMAWARAYAKNRYDP